MERLVTLLREAAVVKLVEVAGGLSVIAVAIQYCAESDERYHERNAQFWGVVNSAGGTRSEGGRRVALEQLNQRGVSLAGIDLRGAYLPKAQLAYADLHHAKLDSVDLSGANLCGANLVGASLQGANLSYVNLDRAIVVAADLRGANLVGADIRWAEFSAADLRGIELPFATGPPNYEYADLREATLAHDIFGRGRILNANVAGATIVVPRGETQALNLLPRQVRALGKALNSQAVALTPHDSIAFARWTKRRLDFVGWAEELGSRNYGTSSINHHRRQSLTLAGTFARWFWTARKGVDLRDPLRCAARTRNDSAEERFVFNMPFVFSGHDTGAQPLTVRIGEESPIRLTLDPLPDLVVDTIGRPDGS